MTSGPLSPTSVLKTNKALKTLHLLIPQSLSYYKEPVSLDHKGALLRITLDPSQRCAPLPAWLTISVDCAPVAREDSGGCSWSHQIIYTGKIDWNWQVLNRFATYKQYESLQEVVVVVQYHNREVSEQFQEAVTQSYNEIKRGLRELVWCSRGLLRSELEVVSHPARLRLS